MRMFNRKDAEAQRMLNDIAEGRLWMGSCFIGLLFDHPFGCSQNSIVTRQLVQVQSIFKGSALIRLAIPGESVDACFRRFLGQGLHFAAHQIVHMDLKHRLIVLKYTGKVTPPRKGLG